LTRSGDTRPTNAAGCSAPAGDPDHHPESLNILLASKSGSDLLLGLATVILDEIHALAGTKRGTTS